MDVHNVTTKHFNDHFKIPDDSPNFTLDYTNEESLASSKTLFMLHPNHQSITLELRELLWTALTRPQTTLMAPNPHQPLRDKLGISAHPLLPSPNFRKPYTRKITTHHLDPADLAIGCSNSSSRPLLKLFTPNWQHVGTPNISLTGGWTSCWYRSLNQRTHRMLSLYLNFVLLC
jgi:hypothetical protein